MRQPVQQLIQLYQNNLFTAAFNICQNQMDAEDAVQETFVQYYTSRKEFENEQHIRAWLLRVVINKAKNINRTFWKKNKCSLDDYMETLSFPDSQSRDLFEEVMKLPDKYRIVIHLFYYEDYSVREIAEILKLSESNVKVRLSRGRALLKDSLKEEWEMTNGEKYKKAFSVLQTSKGSLQEVENMAKLQRRTKMKTAAAVIAGCIILGGTGTAYAANVGGIQRTVQIWLHGDQTQATLDVSNDGTYTMEYYNEDGTLQQTGGGGVSIDADGTQRALTAEELMEEINSPDVEYKDDGSVWVYFRNQSIDITDKFDDNNVCFVKVTDGKETFYLTVKYKNGYTFSNDKYIEP